MPIKYLGIPFTSNYLKARNYKGIIDQCRSKIEGWMSTTLSFSGRVELIKTVKLGSLQYWLQSFQFPISVIKALESMLAKFLWRDRMPAWSWEKLCKPKEEGGLAIRKITDVNKAAGIKLEWRCCNSKLYLGYMDEKALCKLSLIHI